MRCGKARKILIRHIDGEIKKAEHEKAFLFHLDKCQKCNRLLTKIKGASLAASGLRHTTAAGADAGRPAKAPRTIQENVYSFIYQQSLIPPPLVPSYVPKLVAATATLVVMLMIGTNLLWQPLELPFIDVIGDVAYMDRATGQWKVIHDSKRKNNEF